MRSSGFSDVCIMENHKDDSFDLDFIEFNKIITENFNEEFNADKLNSSDCSFLESLCVKWNNNELDDSKTFNLKFQTLKKLNKRKQKSKYLQKKKQESITFSPENFLKNDPIVSILKAFKILYH
jgi:hypothetical protein